MDALKYLAGYSDDIKTQVRTLLAQDRLGTVLLQKYGRLHDVRTDRALYDYVIALKNAFLRNAAPLSKVAFDNQIKVIQHALGLHTAVSRVQGNKLKAKREIRIASLFREVPLEFLKMITVHELAHLKETQHDKAFYQLCTHMEPNYHQYEFDLRLYLTQVDAHGKLLWPGSVAGVGATAPAEKN
ncbi:MAG: M48 family metallopeptidase [Glaciimonas sp.]|nr:M48 family metallopeptidase [Glaciimonas sp.]